MMALVTITMYSKKSKQKINTSISTVVKMVGVDDHMPDLLWSKNFLKAQSMQFEDNIIFRDN